MDFTKITRVNNNSYLIQTNETNKRILVDASSIKDHNKKRIIKKLIKEATYNNVNSKLSLKASDSKYIIKQSMNSISTSKITSSIQPGIFENVIKLKIDYKTISKNLVSNFSLKSKNNLALWEHDSKCKTTNLNNNFKTTCRKGLYSDPYTKLATHAFQKYHTDFDQKKENEPLNPLIITATDTQEKRVSHYLCHTDEYTTDNFLPHSVVVGQYRDYLLSTWNPEKVSVIELRYGIDFAKMIENNEPLTVDIVYKMNIGLSNLEIQDVQYTKETLVELKNELSHCNHGLSLKKAMANSQCPISIKKQLLTHLKSEFQTENPKVLDALKWFDAHPFIESENHCTELPNKELALLINLTQLEPVELERMYTGRKLQGFVDSAYTLAGITTFKPWVDDQELSESCQMLLNNTSWDYFTQQLAYVVCKKHLMHRHPSLDYYVGALIPAPMNPGSGIQEWYRVTSCINNGAGNLSYTLEPASLHSQLPVIKLFRSTASDPYAFDFSASVKSDLNPLNSPGYEGQLLVEPYERELFMKRTIPFWVGYHYYAKKSLQEVDSDLDDTAKMLQQANNALLEEEVEKLTPSSAKEIIRRYDWLILNMLTNSDNGFSIKNSLKLSNLIKKYAPSTREKPISTKEQRSDAKFLLKILAKNPTPENEKLSAELRNNLFSASYVPFLEELGSEELSPLIELQHLYEQKKSEEADPEELLEILNNWSNQLSALAQARNEDIESKSTQKFVCVGHSLGGALAQRTFAKYTFLMNRMPLPGQEADVYDYAAPGINDEDNADFINKGNRHAKLLMNSQIRPVHIHRTQLVGDFFPIGGISHLGATKTAEEANAVSAWMNFEARLLEPSTTATHQGITDTPFAHGIQPYSPSYAMDENIKNYTSMVFTTHMQGQFDRKSSIQKKIWKIDPALSHTFMLDKEHALGRILLRQTYSKKTFLDDPLHGPWKEKRTEEGVFVVNEEGVVQG